jgi:hypothetical protein
MAFEDGNRPGTAPAVILDGYAKGNTAEAADFRWYTDLRVRIS